MSTDKPFRPPPLAPPNPNLPVFCGPGEQRERQRRQEMQPLFDYGTAARLQRDGRNPSPPTGRPGPNLSPSVGRVQCPWGPDCPEPALPSGMTIVELRTLRAHLGRVADLDVLRRR